MHYLSPHALGMQSVKFRPFVDPKKLRLWKIKYLVFFCKNTGVKKLIGIKIPPPHVICKV